MASLDCTISTVNYYLGSVRKSAADLLFTVATIGTTKSDPRALLPDVIAGKCSGVWGRVQTVVHIHLRRLTMVWIADVLGD